MRRVVLYISFLLITVSSNSQTSKTVIMTDKTNNPLLCDPELGFCEIPTAQASNSENYITQQQKPIKIIYFTDPICSSCWGIEPQLRKLKLEYGNYIEIEYRMGGLLPDWSYNSGGISKPSDVAHHWDEVSKYYNMPIDGDVWYEDPLNSSYPPSIAFKAAQLQDDNKAIQFLRRIREMVFLEKKNITKWEHISKAAKEVGLNEIQLKLDYEHKAEELFNMDLALAKSLGVKGFPTLFFTDSINNKQTVYGFKPYTVFEEAILQLDKKANKLKYDSSLEGLFYKYSTLTLKEFSELSGLSLNDSELLLQKYTDIEKLTKLTTKNGSIWKLKS